MIELANIGAQDEQDGHERFGELAIGENQFNGKAMARLRLFLKGVLVFEQGEHVLPGVRCALANDVWPLLKLALWSEMMNAKGAERHECCQT